MISGAVRRRREQKTLRSPTSTTKLLFLLNKDALLESKYSTTPTSYLRVMCHNEHGGVAFFDNLLEIVKNPVAVGPVQLARRLIGKDQLGSIHEGPGNGDALPFTGRKTAGGVGEAVGHMNPFQSLADASLSLALVDFRVDQRQLKVLTNGARLD
jgi:hypothetical protein